MAHLPFNVFLVLCFSVPLVASVDELEVQNVSASSQKYTAPTDETQTNLRATTKSKVAEPHISFACEGGCFLYVNGQFKARVAGWRNVGNAYHALKAGDVVSIYARGMSQRMSGLIATVYIHNLEVSTGGRQWKAIAFSQDPWKYGKYVRYWRTNKGSSCQWPAPITRPLRKLYAKELRQFPPVAQVAWANGANARNVVLFRYVVGGEKCTTHLPMITFAANDVAWLYVDGKLRGSVSHWSQVKRVHTKLTKGSVVALKARDVGGWHGVIADLTLATGQHIVTGQPVWKAIRGYLRDQRNPPRWRTKTYSSCHWPSAATLPRQNQPGIAKKFPYKDGARYVWADKVGERSVVLLRYVVGGERCGQQTRIYVRSRAKSWIYINGLLAVYVRSGGSQALYRHLRKGDVIGVLSKGRRRRGVLLAMQGPLGYVYSGGPGWKGRMGEGPRGWVTNSYSSCAWRRAVVLGKIRGRYARKGRMIWGSRHRRGVSLVRYVVGGEECSSIKYESKGPVRLYVNGRSVRGDQIGRNTWAVHNALKKADVVGIVGYRNRIGGKGALRAVIGFKGKHYATGNSEWRVTRSPRNSGWTRKGFDACGWGSGKVVGGWKRLGDSPVTAKALWANGKATALRFVVGGEYCKRRQRSPPPPKNAKKAVMTLTGDNKATMFLNGKAVLTTNSWRSVARAVVEVKTGDVFGVHARDGGLWYGVRVGLVIDGKEMGTGVGKWRARGARGAGKAWKKADFDGCGWAKVVTAADVDSLFEHGAPRFGGTSKYIWASGIGAGEDMIGRFVLGRSC